MVLVMDPSRRVFGGYDDLLVKLADSPGEAVEWICSDGGWAALYRAGQRL